MNKKQRPLDDSFPPSDPGTPREWWVRQARLDGMLTRFDELYGAAAVLADLCTEVKRLLDVRANPELDELLQGILRRMEQTQDEMDQVVAAVERIKPGYFSDKEPPPA
jgi:hypothetical protein